MKSAKKSWSDSAPVAGQQLEYAFDDIGNRTSTKVGGDTAGANQRSASYSPNSLNQYTSRTVPPFVEVQGAATNSATLTVNGQSPSRHGEYFRAELAVDNAAAPVWLNVTNLGLLLQGTNVLAAATTGHLLVRPATQTFTHDLDGNQTSDGVWTNTWNAENRMMTTETLSTVPVPARRREVWSHLPDGRWSQRIVSTNNGTSYFPAFTNRYVWDGKVLLAVLDHTNGVVMTFLRGLDLSGSMQGAGGVGGVLAVSFATNGTHFDAYDGNGNVAGLVAASNATVTATYEYAAFGEVLRATGPAAKLNPIQFSTQYSDEVRGTVKYLFRDYEASGGRWLSRDPIGERGGGNLYGFVGNRPVTHADVLGMFSTQVHVQITSWAYSHLGEGCRPCCSSKGFFESLARGAIAPDLAMDFPGSTGLIYPWMSDLYTGYTLFDQEFLPSQIEHTLEGWVSTVGGWLVPDDLQNWWQNQSIGGTAIQIGNQLDPAHFGPLYQTHFGHNAWQHAMSASGQTAQQVHQSLVNGTLALIMEYRKGVESGNCEQAAFALGKALHSLQDSYSESHTERGGGGIRMFQNYGLQSAHLHEGADNPSPGSDVFGNAVGATSSFICMAGNKRLSEGQLRSRLANVFFQLAPNAIAGDKATLIRFAAQPTGIPPLTSP